MQGNLCPFLGFEQRLLGSLALGDVNTDSDQLPNLARFILDGCLDGINPAGLSGLVDEFRLSFDFLLGSIQKRPIILKQRLFRLGVGRKVGKGVSDHLLGGKTEAFRQALVGQHDLALSVLDIDEVRIGVDDRSEKRLLSLDFLLGVQQALDQLHVAKAGGDVGDEHFEQRAVQGGERLAGIEKDGGVMVRGDLQV